MAMWQADPQPLALRATAMAAVNVDGGLGLIEEEKALGFEIDLALEPVPTLPQDVGSILLDRLAGLFRVIPYRVNKR
jgi:transposase